MPQRKRKACSIFSLQLAILTCLSTLIKARVLSFSVGPSHYAHDVSGAARVRHKSQLQATDRVLEAISEFQELTEATYEEQRSEMEDILESLRAIETQNPSEDVTDISESQSQEATVAEDMDVFSSGPEEVDCDVCIVGGGPAGCTCALYMPRARLKTLILDKNPATGALAITSHIANYPGVDKSISGEELLDLIRKQAIDYGTDY